MLDQERIWIDPKGFAHEISKMDTESCLWSLDFALANARMLRNTWCIEFKQSYDEGQRARRWMLDKIVIRALMRRVVAIELEQEEEVRLARERDRSNTTFWQTTMAG